MKTRYIGDIHGKWMDYLNVIQNPNDPCSRSVQVGDFGMGFGQRKEHEDYVFGEMNKNKDHSHRFIRGNHDDPARCLSKFPNFIEDASVSPGNIMYIGGALSVDKEDRIQGVSWWEDEELSYDVLFKIIDIYEDFKPDVMVTHECVEDVVPHLFHWYTKLRWPSRTREAFSSMWNIHKPKLWIFGHWHADRDVVIDGTRFVCLNELSYIDIDDDDPMSGSIVPFGIRHK